LRFLRARKFDMNKTLTMWNTFMKWRKDNKVDEIESYVFSELPDVKKFYPHGYFKTDKEGRPIYIERIGALKIKELFKVTTEERLIRYYMQSYENLIKEIFPACSRAAGKRIEQCVTILDLKGGSTSILSSQVYNFIKLASSIAQDNYPEILGRMFIVNAPMLFSGIWAMIKPWLDEKTRNKITIIGSKYEPQLLELIPIENLPDFLGGKSTVLEYGEHMNKEVGPWVTEKIIREQKKEENKEDKNEVIKQEVKPQEKKEENKEGRIEEKSHQEHGSKPSHEPETMGLVQKSN